jgi:hypothetical protein
MNERWKRQMEQIWREVEEKQTKEGWVRSRLQWEDWESLAQDAVKLAKQELRRRRWRGARSGVVPRGYDAQTIAWEMIGEMVQGKSRLMPGWTRERLLKELERLISGKVRLLNSLKETRAVRNEWDISPPKENGERVSILSGVPGEEKTAYDVAVEAEEGPESVRKSIEAQLESEPELKAVFGCVWEGERVSGKIAQRLGMEEKAVVLARRRLRRRLKEILGPERRTLNVQLGR